MSISHILGTTAANVSHFLGTAKANVAEIFGATTGFSGGGLDTDAAAFLTAISNSDPTIESAINQLVLDIKAISSGDVWDNKLKVICPMVGGTAASHAVNLRNPGTHNGTMNGTITHNANGVTGDLSTGYINTNFNQSTDGAEDDEHVSIYSRTDFNGSPYILGVADGSGHGTTLGARRSTFFQTKSQSSGQHSLAATNSLGYFSINRTASTDYRKEQNSTNTNVTQSSDIAPINLSFYVLCQNRNGTPLSFASHNLAWYALGRGLTQTEDGLLQAAVEIFQDALSRGVV